MSFLSKIATPLTLAQVALTLTVPAWAGGQQDRVGFEQCIKTTEPGQALGVDFKIVHYAGSALPIVEDVFAWRDVRWNRNENGSSLDFNLDDQTVTAATLSREGVALMPHDRSTMKPLHSAELDALRACALKAGFTP
jgi:hypothetical protein